MIVFKPRELVSSLLSKGSKYADNDHKFLILYINGEKTGIRTKVSHNNKGIGEGLISLIKKQLRLDSKAQLVDLKDCPMSYDDYLNHLRAKNIV